MVSPMRLTQKLGIKEGMRLFIRDAPDGYLDLLAPLPAGAGFVSEEQAEAAFLQLFIRDLGHLESLSPVMLELCGENSLLWISYPKVNLRSAHGLSRDIVQTKLRKIGWRAVTVVAVDGIWPALRIKRIER
jgi:hypothetical protein